MKKTDLRKNRNAKAGDMANIPWLRLQVRIRRVCRNLSRKEGSISLSHRKAAYLFLFIPPVLFNVWLLMDGGKAGSGDRHKTMQQFKVPGLNAFPVPEPDSIQQHFPPQNFKNYEKAIDQNQHVKKD